MSETKNLKLFKHDEPLETNENKFDIDLALNQNWDKIDKFADTVDDKVTNLQKQNTKLESQIKKDRENMINLEVEGQSIHIEDSSDLEGKLEVLGNVEQETTGKNLLNNTAKTTTVNGVTFTVNEDGTVIANGTATSLAQISLVANVKLPAGTYTIKDGKAYVESTEFNDWFDGLNNPSTLTFNTEVLLKNVYIQIKQGETVSNKTFYPQIEKGTKATEYEQYIEKAIPEHNSEIRAVGDNINLWDKENMLVELGGYSGSNGNKYDSTTRIRNTKDIELKKGIYTLSAEDSKLISVYIVNLKKEISSNGDSATFTLEKDDTIRFTIENTALLNTKIKLERGNKKTSYSKFGQGSVEIKKQNKNIILIKPNQKVVTRGLTVETDDNARITINGIAENTTYLKLYKEIAGTYLSEAEKWEKEKIAKGNYRLSIQNLKGNYNTGNPNILMRNSPNSNTEISYLLQELNKDKSIKCTIDKSMEVMWYMYIQKDVIFNNFSFELLLEKTEMNEYSNYILGEEQTYTLPIQKPMLEEDHFNRTDNKEVHTWKKIVLDGVNNKVTQTTTNQSGKYRYQYIDKDLKDCSLSEEKAYCTHLPLIGKSKTYDKILGFTVANNSVYIYTDGDTASNFNAKLQKENYIFYIPVIESAYEKIDLTPEQTKILDELDNFTTYKPVTNTTTDSIAKLRLKYIADTKTYVDNKTSNLEQQVSVINQLLNTTKTSSVLLDNLQKDIESEVL
jgi:hypothetical protein|nr:MAG TPA: hypothetical protein [Bacteriophage sp.]